MLLVFVHIDTPLYSQSLNFIPGCTSQILPRDFFYSFHDFHFVHTSVYMYAYKCIYIILLLLRGGRQGVN